MDRDRARELLSDYLEGELAPAEREALEARLAEDEVLQGELRALRRTLSALGSLPAEAPPDDFLQRVQRKLKRERKSPFDVAFGIDRKIPFEAVSMVLIGILLALYLLLVVLPREQPGLDPDPPKRLRQDAGVEGGSARDAARGGARPREEPARPGERPSGPR